MATINMTHTPSDLTVGQVIQTVNGLLTVDSVGFRNHRNRPLASRALGFGTYHDQGLNKLIAGPIWSEDIVTL